MVAQEKKWWFTEENNMYVNNMNVSAKFQANQEVVI